MSTNLRNSARYIFSTRMNSLRLGSGSPGSDIQDNGTRLNIRNNCQKYVQNNS